MSFSEIIPFSESKGLSFHRRSHHHDYHAPFIYHIILKKRPGVKPFGEVEGNAKIPFGQPGCARIKESDLGKIIAKAILHLLYEFPILKPLQFCIMPDHVHLLLQVLFRSEQHLDFYMDNLVERIAAKYSALTGIDISPADIFLKGYCDKPLYQNRSLNGFYIYIQQNPHRLAMRQQYPQFFQRVRKMTIKELECEAYGNLFLLRNPDKMAVKISHNDTPAQLLEKKNTAISAAERGTVLVSPFIHKAEKNIRSEAEKAGAKIILITHTAFGELYKPAAHDFGLCSQGRLLIISLGMDSKTPLTRPICETMNQLALTLSTLSD